MKKEIKFLTYAVGSQITTATVNINGVMSIDEHPEAGEGDKWYYDIHYESGSTDRVFNPLRVLYSRLDG